MGIGLTWTVFGEVLRTDAYELRISLSADSCSTVKGIASTSATFCDMPQISLELDGHGLRRHLPFRPPLQASNTVLVHRLASLLRASFWPRLTTSRISPLRFAMTSLHQVVQRLSPQAFEHARHTRKGPEGRLPDLWLHDLFISRRRAGSLLLRVHFVRATRLPPGSRESDTWFDLRRV